MATEQNPKRRRQDILGQLVELVENAENSLRKARDLIHELEIHEKYVPEPRQSLTGPYSDISDPSTAVAAYLKDCGRPQTMHQIVEGVFEGGYLGGNIDDYAMSVRNAIYNRLTGTGSNHPELALASSAPVKKYPDALIALRTSGMVRNNIGY